MNSDLAQRTRFLESNESSEARKRAPAAISGLDVDVMAHLPVLAGVFPGLFTEPGRVVHLEYQFVDGIGTDTD